MMEECHIKFPGPFSKKTLAQLVIDYLKYILYYRGQFPLPLDQLKILQEKETKAVDHPKIDGHSIYCDEVNTSSVRPILPKTALDRSRQKFYETISKFDNFFNELGTILETESVMEIVLNIGPNMMNPKELYHIRMPQMCPKEECASTDSASLQNYKMQFFKNVVNSDLWAGLKSDSLLPISVLLLLDNDVILDERMEQKRFYALPKNCKQRTVYFMDKCSHVEDTLQVDEHQSITVTKNSASGVTKASGLWVKLKPDLKGFKAC